MNRVTNLDPKAYITFRRVFGQNPELLTSLLNALLPFRQVEDRIVEILKDPLPEIHRSPFCTTLRTHCMNGRGSTVIIDTRIIYTWTSRKQILTEAAGACFPQYTGEGPDPQIPVYSLIIVDDDIPDNWEYRQEMEEAAGPESGLHVTIIELPRFKNEGALPPTTEELWLRFLIECGGDAAETAPELTAHPLIGKAVRLLDSSAYSEEEMLDYTRSVQSAKAVRAAVHGIMQESYGRGRSKGFEEGFARWYREGVNTGIIAGVQQQQRDSARRMAASGISVEDILRWTGIREYEIGMLK